MKQRCHHHAFHVHAQQRIVDTRLWTKNDLTSRNNTKSADALKPKVRVMLVDVPRRVLISHGTDPVITGPEPHNDVASALCARQYIEFRQRQLRLDV
jgi:hypothetical protein